ncbi:MAG TPA: hypothetical protein VMR00_16680 [Streptosporangiaceae bacterium]|jgi:hypothetical protein|nr:hypothetical protein [Streptosporangiaceae bacterium]
MTDAEQMAGEYTIRPLGPGTWDAFAQLAGRHNGVWNGCWCTWFHASVAERGGQGLADAALHGALHLIAQAGGGVVEAYPQDTDGRKVTASFLYSATRSLFEKAGFSYERPKGKNHCVMRRTVSPA